MPSVGMAYRDHCERVLLPIPFLKLMKKREPPEEVRKTAASGARARATTSYVTVTTPDGALKSNVAFRVP